MTDSPDQPDTTARRRRVHLSACAVMWVGIGGAALAFGVGPMSLCILVAFAGWTMGITEASVRFVGGEHHG